MFISSHAVLCNKHLFKSMDILQCHGTETRDPIASEIDNLYLTTPKHSGGEDKLAVQVQTPKLSGGADNPAVQVQ